MRSDTTPTPRTTNEEPDATRGRLRRGGRLRATAPDATRIRRPDVWCLEDGYQSNVPSALRAHYDGRETVSTVSPDEQATRLRSAIALAACQAHVRAFFDSSCVDETRLGGWQSGLVWRGVHRKPAAAASRPRPAAANNLPACRDLRDMNSQIEEMLRALTHRGPDSGGAYTDSPVRARPRRLSIIDLAGGDRR